MSQMKVWIAGANGQLGKAVSKELEKDYTSFSLLETDIDECDITDAKEVRLYVNRFHPDIIINCAAITSLSRCEDNPLEAFKVNAIGARNLCAASNMIGAKFIQISTDDVFDGTARRPMDEFDAVCPVTVYGKSRLAAERYVKELNPRHIIISSSWIYGDGESNIVSKLIEQAKNNEVIEVPTDQISTPTSAKEIAKFIHHLINAGEYGTYHVTCQGMCSRYEFALKILELAGLSNTMVKSVLSNPERGVAHRSRMTILENMMMKLTSDYVMPEWQDALEDYIKTYHV